MATEPATIDVDVDGLLNIIKVERQQFCEAIEDLRKQYASGFTDDQCRQDWIEELEASGHGFVAGQYDTWCKVNPAD